MFTTLLIAAVISNAPITAKLDICNTTKQFSVTNVYGQSRGDIAKRKLCAKHVSASSSSMLRKPMRIYRDKSASSSSSSYSGKAIRGVGY